MNSITDEYNTAVTNGNAQYADYLSQIMSAAHQQYGTDLNGQLGVTGATPAAATPATPGTGINHGLFYDYSSIGDNLARAAGALTGVLATPITCMFGGECNPSTNASTGIGAVGATNAALDFATDVPRVVTVILGFLLIAAGLFALVQQQGFSGGDRS